MQSASHLQEWAATHLSEPETAHDDHTKLLTQNPRASNLGDRMPKPKTPVNAKSGKSKSANEVKSVAAIEAEIELLEEQRERADARRREEAKPKLTAEQAKVQKERDEFYAEHKEKIDKELKNCTGHLRKLDIQVARDAIRRLEAYYLKHGIN